MNSRTEIIERLIRELAEAKEGQEIGTLLSKFGDFVALEENGGEWLVKLGKLRPDLVYDAGAAIKEAFEL